MSRQKISPEALARALSIRDLTDPAKGPHAMQVLLHELVSKLCGAWSCRAEIIRGSPIVSVHDNYDALGYPPDGAARDARYSRYVTDDTLLRTQMSAMIPQVLSPSPSGRGVGERELIVLPGLVYRRDTVDRLHVGEPHQVDLWLISQNEETTREMCELVITAALPGREWRVTSTTHPYTTNGLQLDVRDEGEWIEVGECGESRLSPGLAMGLGLDRLLMLRKGIPDIRLLRAEHPQLLDLEPWRPLSNQPSVTRDLSLAVHPSRAEAEVLGDRLREALGTARAELVESIYIVSVTEGRTLPPAARARIGIDDEQLNVLLRVVLRAVDRTLTTEECNQLRDDIYLALHEGRTHQLILAP
ncbi:MAG: hypothetical protein JNM17_13300 [Archangium sp.]|nr:hypothetical protein [Archangium sp.]